MNAIEMSIYMRGKLSEQIQQMPQDANPYL